MTTSNGAIIRIIIGCACILAGCYEVVMFFRGQFSAFRLGIVLACFTLAVFCFIWVSYLNYIMMMPYVILIAIKIYDLIKSNNSLISGVFSILQILTFVYIGLYLAKIVNNDIIMVIVCIIAIGLMIYNMQGVIDSVKGLNSLRYRLSQSSMAPSYYVSFLPIIIAGYLHTIPFISMLILTIKGEL